MTLSDVVGAIEEQTEYSVLLDDRFKEFIAAQQTAQAQARLDALEARSELSKALSGDVSGSGGSVEDTPMGDPVKPSKEAGMILAAGKAFGIGGLGIGAAAAGIGYLVSQILDFGPAMSRMAQGLSDLEKTEVTGEQFNKLGTAIADLVSGVGIGGAIGLRILAGTAFTDLADGITKLNGIQFDPGNLVKVGEGLDGLLSPLNAFDLGEAKVLQMFTGLESLASGINALSKAEVPSPEKMGQIGEGLNAMLDPLSAGDLGEAGVLNAIDENIEVLANGLIRLNSVDAAHLQQLGPIMGKALASILEGVNSISGMVGLQAIDDNLIPLANGINALNQVDIAKFNLVGLNIGPAFQKILDGTDDLLGATGLQTIDDNLKPIADGIKYMTDVVNPEVLDQFDFLSRFIGPAFERMLDGTDDLLGAVGLQAIDDNLKPMADGIKYMSDVGGEVDLSNVGNIVDAYNELGRMETLSDTKVKRLAMMLGAITPVQSQRTDAIAANTDASGGGSNVTIVNAPSSSSTTNNSNIQQNKSPLPTPVHSNYGRIDAYAG